MPSIKAGDCSNKKGHSIKAAERVSVMSDTNIKPPIETWKSFAVEGLVLDKKDLDVCIPAVEESTKRAKTLTTKTMSEVLWLKLRRICFNYLLESCACSG